MGHTKTLTIDPTKIDTTSLDVASIKALNQFLNNQTTYVLWNKNETYTYLHQNINYKFCFTHSLLKRQRKEGKIGERFEIFDSNGPKLGEGGYSIVYPILGAIKFEMGKPVLKKGKQRIVKIEQHNERDRSQLVEREYQHLLNAGHLGVKPPVFTEKKSFLVMKKAPGRTLEDILQSLRYGNHLSITQRMEITFAILHAVKSQVVEQSIVHRDLKPLNMLVDFINPQYMVTVIDYGQAIKLGQQDKRRVGTTAYRAPEAYTTSPTYSSASDSYAVGRILSYLWGDDYNNYYIEPGTAWNTIKKHATNASLFSNPSINLFKNDRKIIRSCLSDLMCQDASQRITLNKAIDIFATIDCRKYENNKIRDYSKSELRNYEASLKKRIKILQDLLLQLSQKGKELQDRGFKEAAECAKNLHEQLEMHTKSFAANPDPALLASYRKSCFSEIRKSKAILQQNRDSRWLLGEIAIAISLLGVGYVFVAGIHYCLTGRLGLFSQTRSDQLVGTIKSTINHLSP